MFDREETPHPFFKCVGGKRRLLGALCERVPAAFDVYEERFLGGGALFFHLRREGLLGGARVLLTDTNERLVRAYRAVRDDVEAVLRLLHGHARLHCLDHYEAWKRAAADPAFDDADDAEVAAWFLYVNQAGYNGLYRVNKAGAFNTPYGDGSPVVVDEDNLRACARALRAVDIRCVDFADKDPWAFPSDVRFVYFDPPYVPVDATANFTGYTAGGFARPSQERLARHALALKRRGSHVLLTNSDTPLVRELYPAEAWDVARVVLRGDSVNCKGRGRGCVGELVIT